MTATTGAATGVLVARTAVAEDVLFRRSNGVGVPIDLVAVPTVEDGTRIGPRRRPP